MLLRILGAFAGSVALTLGARRRTSARVALKLGELFTRSSFRARFETKGRFTHYLENIPTYLITAEYPAFSACRRSSRSSCRTARAVRRRRQGLSDFAEARHRPHRHDPDEQPGASRRHGHRLRREGARQHGVRDPAVARAPEFRARRERDRDPERRAAHRVLRGNSNIVAQDAHYKFFRFGIPTIAYGDLYMQAASAALLGKGDVIVAVSKSGRAPELLRVLDVAAAGAKVIAITSSNTPLAARDRRARNRPHRDARVATVDDLADPASADDRHPRGRRRDPPCVDERRTARGRRSGEGTRER